MKSTSGVSPVARERSRAALRDDQHLLPEEHCAGRKTVGSNETGPARQPRLRGVWKESRAALDDAKPTTRRASAMPRSLSGSVWSTKSRTPAQHAYVRLHDDQNARRLEHPHGTPPERAGAPPDCRGARRRCWRTRDRRSGGEDVVDLGEEATACTSTPGPAAWAVSGFKSTAMRRRAETLLRSRSSRAQVEQRSRRAGCSGRRSVAERAPQPPPARSAPRVRRRMGVKAIQPVVEVGPRGPQIVPTRSVLHPGDDLVQRPDRRSWPRTRAAVALWRRPEPALARRTDGGIR